MRARCHEQQFDRYRYKSAREATDGRTDRLKRALCVLGVFSQESSPSPPKMAIVPPGDSPSWPRRSAASGHTLTQGTRCHR